MTEAAVAPDSTAVRVALWRAMHVECDAPPYVFNDSVGLMMAAPAEGWQRRPDMDRDNTRLFRASIVARARFIEDLVSEHVANGVEQYVMLGAGFDTFAQRQPRLMRQLKVFEVDRPGPQAWKRQRLDELALDIPKNLRFVPVDFEALDVKAGHSWTRALIGAGFDRTKPALVTSTGVSMYLTHAAVLATLREVVALAPGTTLAMSFMVPLEHVSADVRVGMEFALKGAAASGTPFISFFLPEDMIALARTAGFSEVDVVSGDDLADRYFKDRTDGLRPPARAEELLVATV